MNRFKRYRYEINVMRNIFVFLVVCGFVQVDARAQCNPEELGNTCITKLSDGFNYLKTYKVDNSGGTKQKAEFSYVFTKGTDYLITICTSVESTEGVIVLLYDSNRNQVASSKINNQFLSAIVFPCNATGIFYIQFVFEGTTGACAGSALGFRHKR